jgi:Mg2+/citrate symporter
MSEDRGRRSCDNLCNAHSGIRMAIYLLILANGIIFGYIFKQGEITNDLSNKVIELKTKVEMITKNKGRIKE